MLDFLDSGQWTCRSFRSGGKVKRILENPHRLSRNLENFWQGSAAEELKSPILLPEPGGGLKSLTTVLFTCHRMWCSPYPQNGGRHKLRTNTACKAAKILQEEGPRPKVLGKGRKKSGERSFIDWEIKGEPGQNPCSQRSAWRNLVAQSLGKISRQTPNVLNIL